MKTTGSSDIDDYIWLTGNEACEMLADLSADTAPLHAQVARLRRVLSTERTHLLLEQVELRRRAAAKFTQPERMFFTRVGLEQATDEWIAAYKAARFSDKLTADVSRGQGVADLCCGIGGDLKAFAQGGKTVGVDRDPATAHFAAVNSGAEVKCIDVAEFKLQQFDSLHIDPDRRPTGKRTTSLEYCEPGLAVVQRMIEQVPNAAVKLAPATAVPDAWRSRCELEWISRDRECRQLVAWHGALALVAGRHRATIVSSKLPAGAAARTVVGDPNQNVSVSGDIREYVFDIDSAVLAAKLQGVLAAEHGLSACGSGASYLTGAAPINDLALVCFRVLDVLPYETRRISKYLAERNVGTLEIKKRGVDLDPDRFRRELKLRGTNALTLLVTNAGQRIVAVVAERASFAK